MRKNISKPRRPATAEWVEPMKCALFDKLPSGKEWIYEVKFDGFRALAIKNGSEVEMLSRNRKSLNERYPTLPPRIAGLACKSAVIDGEIVALDEAGRSAFQLLQGSNLQPPEIYFYAFDVIQLDGRDLKDLPVTERKAALEKLIAAAGDDRLRFSPALAGTASEIQRRMQGMNLEGIIAKRKKSKYEAGKRSGSWVKFKWTLEQEFVIGGYTQPEGSRMHFGALLVGYHEGGKLRFASKVGTGFNTRMLDDLHKQFRKLQIEECPFVNLPEPRNIAGSGGITRGQMRLCTWVQPKLVCQIRFTEWTRDGHLRHPSFLGLRDDKPASEVVKEAPSS